MAGEPILIVDDNPLNLKLARVVLAAAGYGVLTAVNAEDALALLESGKPRLILMDLQLPGMDGLELTRRLKSDPERCEIVIVALTAYAMKGDEDKALLAGCDAYMSKPIDTDALVGLVASCWRGTTVIADSDHSVRGGIPTAPYRIHREEGRRGGHSM
jgi:CheY-like chemotaxis protein